MKKIVIDVDEDIYNYIQTEGYDEHLDKRFDYQIRFAVKNGTPLPEGCNVQRIIPKRVDVQKWIYTECPNPNCNFELSTHHGDGYYSIEYKPDFCPNCGQALLWESEEV